MNDQIRPWSEIVGSSKWQVVQPISKGWSYDEKYYIETSDGQKLLLRLSDKATYETKKTEFKYLKEIAKKNILMTKPIDFGMCEEGEKVFLLFSWVEGKDAEEIIPYLSKKEQYRLGYQAGQILQKIHAVIPEDKDEGEAWEAFFNHKIERKVSQYRNCPIKFQGGEAMIKYIEDNRHLLKGRIKTVHHGDYHIGNMVVTVEGRLGIIDFNRMDVADPWEEFNRITFCAKASDYFATGRINGYFNDEVPALFFRLLALYLANNQLSSIPWAMGFGQREIDYMVNQAEEVTRDYGEFKIVIPKWYRSKEEVAKVLGCDSLMSFINRASCE